MTGPQVFLDGKVTLHCGDCREVIRSLPDYSIDSVVTDPPYALVSIVKRFANSPRSEATENTENPYGRTGRGFMGQRWDNGETAFAAEFWAEVLRVLKPGGHVVSFSGTRTYHRMAVAIEDAGFEIRDQIGWLYGSGFPKSHDVSKGIDKAGGISPRDQATMLRERREAAGLSRDGLAAAIGCTASSVRDWEDGRARATGRSLEWIIPSEEYRSSLADLLGYSADERKLIGVSIDRRGDETVIGLGHSGEMRSGSQTEAARQWQGWGTALKPAWEPICLARKPLVGTVAANVLHYGTGALNIDACRVGDFINETPPGTDRYNAANHELGYRPNAYGRDGEASADRRYTENGATNFAATPGPRGGSPAGRWPANVAHDGSDEAVAGFPEADGAVSNGKTGTYGIAHEGFGSMAQMPSYSDSGSAARFFYTAKADAEDRLGSKHPTVKPLDLMQYLCRLVTPPGGVILDPFAGTGTTGEAAWREGFRAVLIEREAEYQADIARRMDLVLKPAKRSAVAKSKNKLMGAEGTPLFGGEAA